MENNVVLHASFYVRGDSRNLTYCPYPTHNISYLSDARSHMIPYLYMCVLCMHVHIVRDIILAPKPLPHFQCSACNNENMRVAWGQG